MSLYVNPSPNHDFDPPFLDLPSPRTVIELGSGTGMVAAAIASVLDRREDLVIATDLPEVCPIHITHLIMRYSCSTSYRCVPS